MMQPKQKKDMMMPDMTGDMMPSGKATPIPPWLKKAPPRGAAPPVLPLPPTPRAKTPSGGRKPKGGKRGAMGM